MDENTNELIFKIIKTLVIKRNNPVINYQFFLSQLDSYFQTHKEEIREKNADEFKAAALPVLKKMERDSTCKIAFDNYESNIISFHVHLYYRQLMSKIYANIDNNPISVFPNAVRIPFIIDPAWITVCEADSMLVDLMENDRSEQMKVIQLIFSEDITDIIVPPDIIKTTLISIAAKKINIYMMNPTNAGFLKNYLMKALTENDFAVNQMIGAVCESYSKIIEHLNNLNDLSFKFWSYLLNKIISEIKRKKDKTAGDISLYQSAYILRAFSMYRRIISQREAQKKSDYDHMLRTLKKAPYVFSANDIYSFKDQAGNSIAEKYSKDFISSFIAKESASAENELPVLYKIKSASGKESYIHKDMISMVFLKTVTEAGKEIKKRIALEWSEILKKFKKSKDMKDEELFNANLERRINENYEFVAAIYNPNLIWFANQGTGVNDKINAIVADFFEAPGKFLSVSYILGIDRASLLKEVKYAIPVYYSIPIIGRLLALLADFLIGDTKKKGKRRHTVKKQEKNGEKIISEDKKYAVQKEREKNEVRNYSDAIERLKEEFLDSEDIDTELSELINIWNPLYDKKARNDLVEDINSLIRDFIRPLKKNFKKYPPTIERIQTMTDNLMNKTAKLDEIKKKESFRKYIKLYIIKLLEKYGKI